jgi:hypothetical protein
LLNQGIWLFLYQSCLTMHNAEDWCNLEVAKSLPTTSHIAFAICISIRYVIIIIQGKDTNKCETNNKQTRKVVATKQLLALPSKDKKKLLQRSWASSAEKSGNYTCEVCQKDASISASGLQGLERCTFLWHKIHPRPM